MEAYIPAPLVNHGLEALQHLAADIIGLQTFFGKISFHQRHVTLIGVAGRLQVSLVITSDDHQPVGGVAFGLNIENVALTNLNFPVAGAAFHDHALEAERDATVTAVCPVADVAHMGEQGTRELDVVSKVGTTVVVGRHQEGHAVSARESEEETILLVVLCQAVHLAEKVLNRV